uniref:MLLT10 histone lysine methyltransferase DOT1L cofactor n=1 Tax=Plectus sambesii TaxID=2011161 RepID=A0A914X8I0_9BILA
MVGGCCVCADENGWSTNPLVYCDGPSCEVAVHQGCYGIIEVPDGEWFCAKCSSTASHKPLTDPRCELCPFGFGALKRTENNGWAHVICALYIPEVRFGDVHSMDPVIVADVPTERFERICYLCEEAGEEKRAAIGACMNCNRAGCKKSFHVTCAQQRGLLCEEGGGSKNVKYCGYCGVHAKKAQNDPTIKIIPPYRVRPMGVAKQDKLPRDKDVHVRLSNGPSGAPAADSENAGGKPRASSADRTVVSNCVVPPDSNSLDGSSSMLQRMNNGPKASSEMPKTPLELLAAATVIPLPATTVMSSADAVSLPSTTNSMSSSSSSSVVKNGTNGGEPRLNSTTTTTSTKNSSADSEQLLPADPPHPPHVAPSGASPVSSAGPKQASGKRGRPPGSVVVSGNGDGVAEKPAKRVRSKPVKQTVKALLELVNPVIQDTVSDFQRERVQLHAQQAAAAAAAAQLQHQGGHNNASTPGAPSTPSTTYYSPMDQQQPLPGIASLADMACSSSSVMGHVGVPLRPTPKLGLISPDPQDGQQALPSTSSGASSSQTPFPTSLEQLLERQWEQGSQFLMGQAQHFDIASLLSCLHQLKTENQRLEETMMQMGGRRDHLLAVNARLSLALGPQAPASPHHSPRVTSSLGVHSHLDDSSPASALSQLRSLAASGASPVQTAQGSSSSSSLPTKSSQTQASISMANAATHQQQGMPSTTFGSGAGVFASVRPPGMAGGQSSGVHKPDASPDRGAFLVPRTPTPLINPAVSQYAGMTQEQMIQQLMLQQHHAHAVASAYASANLLQQQQQQQHQTPNSRFSGLPTSASPGAAPGSGKQS